LPEDKLIPSNKLSQNKIRLWSCIRNLVWWVFCVINIRLLPNIIH
jgi:hypothetical protein